MLHLYLDNFYFLLQSDLHKTKESFMFVLQDFTDLAVSGASFVPTVTAISSSPDLQWMVQSVVSSVAPSESRVHPYSSNMTFSRSKLVKTGSGNKAPSSSGRRGRFEQVHMVTVLFLYINLIITPVTQNTQLDGN